jgi:hypothetical protein
VGELLDVSMNCTDRGWLPEVTFDTNAATGLSATLFTVIYPAPVLVLLPSEFVAVRVTVNVPDPAYWCTGDCSAEVPPSPNDQAHDVGEFVEVSMNCTDRGPSPLEVFDVNNATGTVAPAAAVRNMSEATREKRSHRVVRFMVFIWLLNHGIHPGIKLCWNGQYRYQSRRTHEPPVFPA